MAEQPKDAMVDGTAQTDTSAQQPPRNIPDEEFKPFRERWTKENERLSEKYDNIISAMQATVANPFPEELAKIEEKLRARYDDLRLHVSEARRAGRDMLMPSLVLREFPAKLVVAHATREPKDYEIARLTLESAQYELDDALHATVVDVKKDVLRMAGLSEKGKEATPTQGTLKKETSQGVSQR